MVCFGMKRTLNYNRLFSHHSYYNFKMVVVEVVVMHYSKYFIFHNQLIIDKLVGEVSERLKELVSKNFIKFPLFRNYRRFQHLASGKYRIFWL
jgi:hypothetical protein